jgi:hypothetical protein
MSINRPPPEVEIQMRRPNPTVMPVDAYTGTAGPPIVASSFDLHHQRREALGAFPVQTLP